VYFKSADVVPLLAIIFGIWGIRESLSPKAKAVPFSWREVFREMGPVEVVGPWIYRLLGVVGIASGISWFLIFR
jgi:hypothetical protein